MRFIKRTAAVHVLRIASYLISLPRRRKSLLTFASSLRCSFVTRPYVTDDNKGDLQDNQQC